MKHVLLIAVLSLAAGWLFRYDYRTKTLNDLECVKRINRFTGERCVFSGDIASCTRITMAPPCSE